MKTNWKDTFIALFVSFGFLLLASHDLKADPSQDDDKDTTLMCLSTDKAMEINQQTSMVLTWIGKLEDGTALALFQNDDGSWIQMLLVKDDNGRNLSCLTAHGSDGVATPTKPFSN